MNRGWWYRGLRQGWVRVELGLTDIKHRGQISVRMNLSRGGQGEWHWVRSGSIVEDTRENAHLVPYSAERRKKWNCLRLIHPVMNVFPETFEQAFTWMMAFANVDLWHRLRDMFFEIDMSYRARSMHRKSIQCLEDIRDEYVDRLPLMQSKGATDRVTMYIQRFFLERRYKIDKHVAQTILASRENLCSHIRVVIPLSIWTPRAVVSFTPHHQYVQVVLKENASNGYDIRLNQPIWTPTDCNTCSNIVLIPALTIVVQNVTTFQFNISSILTQHLEQPTAIESYLCHHNGPTVLAIRKSRVVNNALLSYLLPVLIPIVLEFLKLKPHTLYQSESFFPPTNKKITGFY